MSQRINIDDDIFLSPLTADDKPLLVKHLNHPSIHQTTLRIPYPYSEEDADSFLNHVYLQSLVKKREMHWAIRNAAGELIGGIGLHGKYPECDHRDEVGYWVAADQQGKNIMTRVLKGFCAYLQKNYGLVRIEAPVFDFNVASCRVVEKCGFEIEGILRKAYFKNGKYIDARLYALVQTT